MRQEKIYVSYEKKQLQSLNEAVSDAGRRLSQENMDMKMTLLFKLIYKQSAAMLIEHLSLFFIVALAMGIQNSLKPSQDIDF